MDKQYQKKGLIIIIFILALSISSKESVSIDNEYLIEEGFGYTVEFKYAIEKTGMITKASYKVNDISSDGVIGVQSYQSNDGECDTRDHTFNSLEIMNQSEIDHWVQLSESYVFDCKLNCYILEGTYYCESFLPDPCYKISNRTYGDRTIDAVIQVYSPYLDIVVDLATGLIVEYEDPVFDTRRVLVSWDYEDLSICGVPGFTIDSFLGMVLITGVISIKIKSKKI